MIDSLYRTLCYCIIILGGVYFGSYVAAIEQRVTALEDRARNSFVIPRPLPFDITIDRNKRGDDSK
jgi:hypothetical protein